MIARKRLEAASCSGLSTQSVHILRPQPSASETLCSTIPNRLLGFVHKFTNGIPVLGEPGLRGRNTTSSNCIVFLPGIFEKLPTVTNFVLQHTRTRTFEDFPRKRAEANSEVSLCSCLCALGRYCRRTAA